MKLANIIAAAAIAVLSIGAAAPSQAAPVSVDYTVSGSAGNWTLDFNVANNTGFDPSDQLIYFFGVKLPARNIAGSPTGWDPNDWTDWSFNPSGIDYNNNWIWTGTNGISPGNSLSGFKVLDTAASAPTSVNWFLYSFSLQSGSYTGGGNFNGFSQNPGFEGVGGIANSEGVPAPGALALLGAGLIGIGGMRRRVKAASPLRLSGASGALLPAGDRS